MARPDESALARLTAAAAWSAALTEAGQETSVDFEAWLAQDPGNLDAWAQVQGPLEHIDRNATDPEAMKAREAALQLARGAREPTGLTRRKSAAITAAVTLIGLGIWATERPTIYQTALGERRVLTLADGSHIALDSDSRLEVRLERRARRLALVRGQARFDVAHDLTRPFSVRAGDQTVIATGTNFNVDMLGPKVLVTLIEGGVTVLQTPSRGLSLSTRPRAVVIAKLAAGQQLAAPTRTPAGAAGPVIEQAHIQPASVDRTVAWETGQLVFADERLGAVVERVSRYSPERVTVEGPPADLRISGVFKAGDVETFVDAVQRTLPVRASRTDEGVVLRARSL